MALSKNVVSSKGFTTSYHKVEEVSLRDNHMMCHVASYVSQDYREQERPADRTFFDFNITIEEEESMGIRKLAYTKIKELEDWSDATDC